MGAGRRKEATDLGSEQSGIFFACQLDDPNQIESAEEIEFSAHVIFGRPCRFHDRASFGIELICPSSGKLLCRFEAMRCARHRHSGRRHASWGLQSSAMQTSGTWNGVVFNLGELALTACQSRCFRQGGVLR